MSDDARDTDPRSVLSRAITLLTAFSHAPYGERSLTDLARVSGLPLTTVHRLAGQLQHEGVLERLPSGNFRVGLKLWELGMLAPRSHGLRETALPFLSDLFEVTHQNVQLVVIDGIEAVVVERLRSRNAVELVSRTGGRLPIHATSGGIAILAHSDDSVLTEVLSRPLTRYSDMTITSDAELRAGLAAARQRGYVHLRGHLTPSVVSIAAPVLTRAGEPIAAVSVVVDASTDTAPLIPAIMTTARAIGRALARMPA